MEWVLGRIFVLVEVEEDVWERSFNEVQIVAADRYAACVAYVEQNSVRRALVSEPREYAFSSAAVGAVFNSAPKHRR